MTVHPGLGRRFEPRPGPGARRPPPQPIGAADLLRSEPFDRLTLIDNTVLIVEPVSPRPLPVIDPKKERERRRQAGSATARRPSSRSVEPKTKKGGGRPRRKTRRRLETVKIHLLQGGPQRGPRLQGQAVEHQEDRVLRGPAAGGGRPPGHGPRLRPGVRVLPAGQVAKPGLGGPRRPREPRAVRRGASGPDRRRRRARTAAAARAAGPQARLPRPARPDRRRLRQADRAGRAHGPVRAGPAGPPRAGGASPATSPSVRPCDRSSSPGPPSGSSRASRRDRPSGSTAWSTPCGSGPRCPAPRSAYQKAFEAEPTLDVGVTDVASPLGPWVHSRADDRVIRLLYRPVLATDDQEARQGKRPGAARGVDRDVRPGPSDRDPPASRRDVVRRLAAGLGDRRRPLPDRAQRPATRPPTRRAGPTCSIGSRSGTRPASRSGSTMRP